MACALAVVATAPAHAQAPALGLEGQSQVEEMLEPVEQATEYAMQVAAPVEDAAQEPARVAEPVVQAVEPVVAAAAEPVVGTAGTVADAAAPALDAATPSVRLSAPALRPADLVRAVTQADGGPRPSARISPQGREGSRRSVAGPAGRGSGGPRGGAPGSAERSPDFPGRATAVAGADPLAQTAPAAAAEDPPAASADPAPLRKGAAPARVPTPDGAGGRSGAFVTTLPRLSADILTATAHAGAPLASGGRPTGSASSDQNPGPSPSGPAAAGAAASAAAGSVAPVLALLVLLLLAAPRLSHFLRTVPAFLRPAPFLCALERPG